MQGDLLFLKVSVDSYIMQCITDDFRWWYRATGSFCELFFPVAKIVSLYKLHILCTCLQFKVCQRSIKAHQVSDG